MKKNLWAIFAILLAVSLSAFTGKKDIDPPKPTDPYWYYYNPSTDELTSFVGQMTQATLIANTDCKNNVNQPICSKGYSSSQGTSFPIPAPGGATNVLKKTP